MSDLGIGLSTLGKWVRAVSEEAKVPAQDAELLRENERLRKENRILRDLSRNRKRSGGLFSGECGRFWKSGDVLRGSKAVRYEPDQKTIRGIVFPAIEYIATYCGA